MVEEPSSCNKVAYAGVDADGQIEPVKDIAHAYKQTRCTHTHRHTHAYHTHGEN